MNKENIDKLIAFFEGGAPHVSFDMDVGLKIESFDMDTALPEGECGTVACIAGGAFWLAFRDMPVAKRREVYKKHFDADENTQEFDWEFLVGTALDWLGLEADREACQHSHHAHPLFSPVDAELGLGVKSWGMTPRHAAQALKRVKRGEHPWR